MVRRDQLLSACSGWKGTGFFSVQGKRLWKRAFKAYKWSGEGGRGSGARYRRDRNHKTSLAADPGMGNVMQNKRLC